MELIIKVTEKCNFRCTFCSSTHLTDDKDAMLPLDDVYRFLERFPETNTIIINGGDPLVVPIKYYWDLLNHIEKNGLDTTLSFTTNLWPFFKNPEKWSPLFQHPRVGVATSYQPDDSRLKHDLTPLTKDEFIQVSDLFKEKVGYRPDFITVVTNDNYEVALEAVQLAKSLGVECKLNNVLGSGESKIVGGVEMGSRNKILILADIYNLYIEIVKQGLTKWEYNTKQTLEKLRGGASTCPLARDCSKNIRVLQPSGDYYSCGAFGDDKEYSIDLTTELKGGFEDPLRVPELLSMKNSCFSCPMFDLCNGCRKTVSDHKRLGVVEDHCLKMKQLAPELIYLSGMEGVLKLTPYINESNRIVTMELD